MKKPDFKAVKLNDIIGAGCGVFVALVLVIDCILGVLPVTAGVKNSEIPAEAAVLTGSAPGRNDDIIVKVVATEDTIYQIKIMEHSETKNHETGEFLSIHFLWTLLIQRHYYAPLLTF